ncbi:MAG: MoaD family protein [Deltaproteobacteria bacterium]|nr:MoaD family protein [Deltaproteobacteria bacterium]
MNSTIEIPSALQKFVNNKTTVEVSGDNVRAAINNLIQTHGGLKEHLFDEQGRIRSFVNIYLNDEDIRYANNLDTEVKAGDVIQIVPSIAGGC